MTEIDSRSFPKRGWTRFQYAVWIASVYEERLDIAPSIAMHVASLFKEDGAVMLIMDRKDWEVALGNIDDIPEGGFDGS